MTAITEYWQRCLRDMINVADDARDDRVPWHRVLRYASREVREIERHSPGFARYADLRRLWVKRAR